MLKLLSRGNLFDLGSKLEIGSLIDRGYRCTLGNTIMGIGENFR